MMNATTDSTKLNFMTDHGSTRASVSCACRRPGRRTAVSCFFFVPPGARFCQAAVTESAYPARPAAAPPTAGAVPCALPGPGESGAAGAAAADEAAAGACDGPERDPEDEEDEEDEGETADLAEA